jgi:hypothetical protein
MIGEIALAIEMGADALDIGKTIHPHPTLGETIGMAAEVAKGVCTDLPPRSRASRSSRDRPVRIMRGVRPRPTGCGDEDGPSAMGAAPRLSG